MDRVECVVVGAGVVGLACARALALAGREVVVLEAAGVIGSETSSRNSEVIHAGIYYPQGSLKARACVAGNRRLYAYCADHGVAHRRCGKLIVACDEAQAPAIEALVSRGRANGVHDLLWLDATEVAALEPELACIGAVLSPSTGILDSHGYMLALQADLEAAGGVVAFNARVTGAVGDAPAGIVLKVEQGEMQLDIVAQEVVLCAGLHAQSVLKAFVGYPADAAPRFRYAKGSYFSFSGRAPFRRLIYPAPQEGGLGVHATLDLAGALRFGPDVEWIDRVDYAVDPRRADGFYAQVRRYWPALPDDSIIPAYAGIRPKLSGPGEPAADFLVQGPREHGVAGLVNLLGVESPGLTGSLVLADLAVASLAAGSQ